VKAGNAGGVDFQFNGKKVDTGAKYGEVKTVIFGPTGMITSAPPPRRLKFSFLPFTFPLPPFDCRWHPLNVNSLRHQSIPLRFTAILWYRFKEN